MKILTLHYDTDMEDPSQNDGFKLYSFGRRHTSYKDPEHFFDNGKPRLWLRNKLRAGTAWVLSYYEHGNCQWSLKGEGPQCRWDSVGVAGILAWEGKPQDLRKTPSERTESARMFLETYTAWCNGEGYGYTVEEVVTLPCGHTETKEIDSCFGFYGNDLDYMFSQIREHIDGDPDVEVRGEASGVASYHDYKTKPKAPESATPTEHQP